MKVILLRDVAKIGKRSEIVEVPDGYARNKLIPTRLAEPASKANVKKIQKLQENSKATTQAIEAKFQAALTVLKDNKVAVPADLNEKDHTFKAVSEDEIVEAATALGADIVADMVHISSPIKEAGEHQVELVAGESKATFTIEVIKK